MAINVTLGTPDYRYNGVIAVPVTFAEAVVAPSKTIFPITHVSGDALTGVTYDLVGENTAYQLIIQIPPNRKGSFQIAGNNGSVLKASVQSGSEAHDTVMVAPKTITYNTTVPQKPVDIEVPAQYTPGKPHTIIVAFNTRVTGWHLNNTLTEIWIQEGADLGTPTPYKWTDTDTPPDIHAKPLPFISVITQRNLATEVAVDAVLPLNLAAFNGAGPIEVTNSVAGAGVYEVRGVDENGDEQTETLTFGASDDTMTTTHNFRSDGLEIVVITAFADDTTADIEVDTIAFAEDHYEILEAPPAGDPTDLTNSMTPEERAEFDENGQWHGEEGQYFLMFWSEVDAGAVGNHLLGFRIGAVRGPVR